MGTAWLMVRGPRRSVVRAFAMRVALLAAVVLLAATALAQTRKPSAGPAPKGRAPAKPAARSAFAPPDGGSPPPSLQAPVSASTSPQEDAGVVETRALDGGTQVFKFKELDIEGRLKSPQLVYFLRRVRAEFGAQELGHRSFMREMSETRKEPSF